MMPLPGRPTVASGKTKPAIRTRGGETERISGCVVVLLGAIASVAVNVTGHAPYWAATPLSVAVERLNWRPAGNAPVIDHAYRPLPPVAARVTLRRTPTDARGNSVVVILTLPGGIPDTAISADRAIS